MTGTLGEVLSTGQLFALAAMLFFFAGLVMIGTVVRVARARIAEIEPVSRARLLSVLAAAPLVLMLAGVGACVLPSAVATSLGEHDHCDHHDGHPHLCPWHAAPGGGSAAGSALLGVFAAALVVSGARNGLDVWRARRLVDGLGLRSREGRSRDGRPREEGHVELDTAVPFSAAIGLLAPIVVVSRGLLERLTEDELAAALAHEHAHRARRDVLRLWLARLVWGLAPRALSEPLLSELALACEEACDRAAAEAVGDPLVVADAIVKASRAMVKLDLGAALGLGPTAVDRRVRALLDPLSRRALVHEGALLCLAMLVLVLAEPLHHVTETILGALYR